MDMMVRSRRSMRRTSMMSTVAMKNIPGVVSVMIMIITMIMMEMTEGLQTFMSMKKGRIDCWNGGAY